MYQNKGMNIEGMKGYSNENWNGRGRRRAVDWAVSLPLTSEGLCEDLLKEVFKETSPQDDLFWTCAGNYSTMEAAVCHLMYPEKPPQVEALLWGCWQEDRRDFVESRLRPGRKK